MTVDAVLLAVVVAFLLPLRLISLVLRLASARGSSAGDLRRSCVAFAVAAALLAAIFSLPRDHARECAAPVAIAVGGDDGSRFREELRSEVEQLKHQLARLELLWDNNSKALDEKGDALEEEDGRVLRAMGHDIQSLINEQKNIKESLCCSYSNNSIKAMENEVQILKDELRKTNSDIFNLRSLAKDTMERVGALHSDIKKVQVITDEWGKMNSNVSRMWSFAKDTEKRVEDLYSDIKRGFKQTKRKVPFWRD